jgi:prevent-host-death family protein
MRLPLSRTSPRPPARPPASPGAGYVVRSAMKLITIGVGDSFSMRERLLAGERHLQHVVDRGVPAAGSPRRLAAMGRGRHNDHMRAATVVGARELKTRLGRYLNRVRRGDTIVVTDRSEPVAELRPIGDSKDPASVALARLAATGGLTLPIRRSLVRIGAARLASGSGSAAVAADRDERG